MGQHVIFFLIYLVKGEGAVAGKGGAGGLGRENRNKIIHESIEMKRR